MTAPAYKIVRALIAIQRPVRWSPALVLPLMMLAACDDWDSLISGWCESQKDQGTALAFTSTDVSVIEGGRPVATVVADFNGDGHEDIVVATEGVPYASLLMNDGRGGFSLKELPLDSLTSVAVVAGDFGGDGKPDIVIAGIKTLHAMINKDGGGLFDEHQTNVPDSLRDVIVGDGNGDRKLDAYGISDRGIFEFNGGGVNGNIFDALTFHAVQSPKAIAFGSQGSSRLFIGFQERIDIVEDAAMKLDFSKPDTAKLPDLSEPIQSLFVANVFSGKTNLVLGTTHSIHVFTLIAKDRDSYELYKNCTWKAANDDVLDAFSLGDFNNDDSLDTVAAVCSKDSTRCRVLFLANGCEANCHWSSASGLNLDGFRTPRSIVVGDFNGDGLKDWAVAGYTEGVVKIGMQKR